ncbi:FKBP-type peptidyl-prolyl cis-trans isomerase [Crenothrix polyspora]|jgi:FKBP-type peptidyl-prolyl cis-trans isomerase
MHAKLLSVITVIVIGLSMFSMANAGTPDENKAAGAAYLATNAKKAGISTTASGLQYEVVTKGTGTKNPAATDKVTVHYKGTTIDGKEFDSSYSRGEPIAFGLNQVIPGWTEGVQLMTEGAKYRFYIPSELAYGENGAGGAIGANEALIFDVELIKIN